MLHFLFMHRAALCPLQHYLLWHCLLRQHAYKLTQQLTHPLDVFWAQSGRSYCEIAPRCWWLHMSSDGEGEFPDGDGRSSDSSEILRGAGPTAHVADGSTEAPAPSTPGGTPLPPGPPPPRPVTELMSVSVRLSTAISQAFAELGHPLHQILTYVPWQYHDLQSIVVRIEPMLPSHVFHPHTLVVDADELGPENNEEAQEEATHATAGEADDAWDGAGGSHDREPTATANQISARMEAEGRTVMTDREVRQLTEHLEEMSEVEVEEDLSRVRSVSDTVSSSALAAAPRGPWSDEALAAAPKPKMGRKLVPQLLELFIPMMLYMLMRQTAPAILLYPGEDTKPELSRSGYRMQGQDHPSFPRRNSPCCPEGIRRPDQSSTQLQLNKKTILHYMTVFANFMLPMLPYMMILYSTLLSSLLARYCCIRSRWMTSSSSSTSRQRRSLVPVGQNTARTSRSATMSNNLLRLQAGTSPRMQSHMKYHNAGKPPTWGSRTGPKSGRQLSRPGISRKFLYLFIWLCLLQVTMAASELADARVGAASVTAPGAASALALAAKPYGARRVSEPPSSTFVHRYLKRTYQRAYARACREGGAYYKGKWYTLDWFARTTIRTQAPRLKRTPQTDCPHWTVISWNAAGLTTATFQEIETYARTVRADIFLLQETKWTFEAIWSSREYHYIGNGKYDRLDGLLVMISTRHATAEQIQYCVHHAGRLLHVRIPHGHTFVDVVSWHQYAVNQQDGTFDRRQRLLIKLQKCLANLPRRNPLILGGDFNCPCERYANVCGPADIPPNSLHYTDHKDHQQVWTTLHLTALNTWIRPQHGQIATFVFEGTEHQPQSQIDFIMIRSHHCTTRSKQACIIESFPVVAWRSGAKHYPVRAEVPLPRPHWTRRTTTDRPVQIDQERLLQDLRGDTPGATLQALRDEVPPRLLQTPYPIAECNHILVQAAQKFYPAVTSPTIAPTQPEAIANCAKETWRLFRLMRTQRFTADGILTAWRTWTQYMQAYRIHKQRSKARSKQRKHDLLAQAQLAASKQDARELYKVIKQLAPRAPRKRLQLYKNGHMIPIEEEMAWILQAYGDRYGETAENVEIHLRFEAHTGITLHAQGIEYYLNNY